MEFVHKAEKSLEGIFKGFPPLSKDLKESLAKLWPWLALLGGIAQLIVAWQLYQWANLANTYTSWARSLGVATNTGFTVWIWAAIATLAVCGVILLLAFPKLQKQQKSGWDLVLLAGLINLVYGVLSMFIDGRGSIGSLFWALIGSGIGFYLLFQVREHFGGKELAGNTGSKTSTKEDDAKKSSK